MDMSQEQKKKIFGVSFVLLIVLSVYFVVKSVNEIRNYGMVDGMNSTITVSGHGEVSAAPDIANIYFTLRGEAKTVEEAQAQVAQSEEKALEVLRNNDVEDKDIKTTNASFSPKYEYVSTLPCVGYECPPRPGKSVIVGYQAYETINVKIRDIDSTGKVVEELGSAGVSDLNGPNFAIDEEDELKAEARKEAINEAKKKAKVLARDLGVRLVGVASFNESGGSIYPMMYDGAMSAMVKEESAPRAELPKGENTISSDVSVTYRIR